MPRPVTRAGRVGQFKSRESRKALLFRRLVGWDDRFAIVDILYRIAGVIAVAAPWRRKHHTIQQRRNTVVEVHRPTYCENAVECRGELNCGV